MDEIRLMGLVLKGLEIVSFFFFVVVVGGFFLDRVSLHRSGCPGIYSVDQAGLKLTQIHLPLPPRCWD